MLNVGAAVQCSGGADQILSQSSESSALGFSLGERAGWGTLLETAQRLEPEETSAARTQELSLR